MNKSKIFISYSHKDREYVYELSTYLKGLIRNGLIETWSDSTIMPGSDWDSEIKSQLTEADIIILLVSSDFIASDYIHNVELKKAIVRHNNGEAIIIPVIIRPCDFSNLEIGKLQALPTGGKPISKWDDKDEAWLDVLNGIKKVIKSSEPILQKRKEKNKNKEFVSVKTEENDRSLKMKLADGKLELVINELLDITKEKDDDLHNSIIMLSGRFNSYKRNYNDRLISDEQADITKNRISKALISIINEI